MAEPSYMKARLLLMPRIIMVNNRPVITHVGERSGLIKNKYSVFRAVNTCPQHVVFQKWTCRDLNSGPLPCQGSDLPTDLHAHVGAYANPPT